MNRELNFTNSVWFRLDLENEDPLGIAKLKQKRGVQKTIGLHQLPVLLSSSYERLTCRTASEAGRRTTAAAKILPPLGLCSFKKTITFRSKYRAHKGIHAISAVIDFDAKQSRFATIFLEWCSPLNLETRCPSSTI